MASKRETIAAAFATALTGTVNVGTRIFRNLEDALTREDSPSLVVRAVSDIPERNSFSFIDSRLTLSVDIYGRGVDVEAVLDPVAVSAYAKIMTDSGIRALVMDIEPGAHNWEFEGADQDAGILTMQFTVLYRHTYGALDV